MKKWLTQQYSYNILQPHEIDENNVLIIALRAQSDIRVAPFAKRPQSAPFLYASRYFFESLHRPAKKCQKQQCNSRDCETPRQSLSEQM
jgi:hypothetical protein